MRGRTISNHAQLFGGLSDGQSGVAPSGQPYGLHMAGTPTAPEYYEGPAKWNALLPPVALGLLYEVVKWLAAGR